MRSKRIIAPLCLLALALAATPTSANLLTNPGFETSDFTGWQAFGDGWRTSSFSLDVNSGDWGAVDDVLSSDGTGFRVLFQNLAASPGQVFDAGVYIRTVSNEETESWLEIQFLDVANAVIQQFQSAHVTTDQEFTLMQLLDLTAPAGTTTISVRGVVHVVSVPGDTDFHIFDDFSLTIPEPASIGMLAIAAAALLRRRRR